MVASRLPFAPPEPAADSAYEIVTEILRIVPASRWAFAREIDGELGNLLCADGNDDILSELKSELALQRQESKAGPRIGATLGPLGIYECGVTLLFADGRTNFGILRLLRTRERGPFTSSEVTMLILALDSASEWFSALHRNANAKVRASVVCCDGAMKAVENDEGEKYVLDRDLQIVMAWTSQDQRRVAITGVPTRPAERLPTVLENTVRSLTASWQNDPATHVAGVARPVPFLVVRTQPVTGAAGLFIGVRIDRFRSAHSLVEPAARFHISARELEVLALLLEGAKLEEIGKALNIANSTVQDHIKSMIDKSESRNRTELVARVLGWESASDELPVAAKLLAR